MSHVLRAVLFVTAMSALTLAQAPHQPTFRSGVDLVMIDANVVDREGQPVAGLGAGHFTVTVDGKPRRIVSADFIAWRPTGTTAPAAPAPAAPRATSTENTRPQTGRVFAIVVDDGNIRPAAGRAAGAAAARFVQRLDPTDQVGLFVIPRGASIDFGTDRAPVLDALERIGGSGERFEGLAANVTVGDALALQDIGPQYCNLPTPPEALATALRRNGCFQAIDERFDCCYRVVGDVRQMILELQRSGGLSLYGLKAVLRSLARVDAPKTIVVISQRLVSGGVGPLDRSEELRELAQLAGTARASLYVFYLSQAFVEAFEVGTRWGPSELAFGDEAAASSGLEQLAARTRGTVFRLTGDADRAFERVARETSAYYLLGIEPIPSDRDGKPHRIKVAVNRKGTEVRARAEFAFRTAAEAKAEDRLADILRSPILDRALPMRVAARVMPAGGDRLQVLVAADLGRDVTTPEAVTVGYVLLDEAGRIIASGAEKRKLEVTGRANGESVLRYVGLMNVPAGRYRMKLAAISEDGRSGSVEHQVEARLTRVGQLTLGDILLASSEEQRLLRGLSLDDSVAGGQARAFVQAAASGQVATPSLAMVAEVADTPEGPALLASPLTLTRTADGMIVADGPLDLRLLPPGDYHVRATVSLEGKPLGSRTTPFHLLVPPGGATSPAVRTASPAAGGGPSARFAAGADRLLVRGFDRQDLLRTEVASYFVDRLSAAGADKNASMAPDVLAAREAVKTGRFEGVAARLAASRQDLLDVRFLRGLAFYAEGQLIPAAAEFRAALKIDWSFLPAAFYLGACFAAGGKDDEAVGAWQMALASESEARIVYEVLVDAFLRLGDVASARQFISEARDRWRDDQVLRPRAAAVALASGDPKEALELLAPYIEGRPGDAQALLLALRAIYQAHAEKKPIAGKVEDAARMQRYAKLYEAAGGIEGPIVARWVQYVEQ